MHERSLVHTLLKQVEQIMCEHDAVSVGAVTVEVGPLSGVEPLLLESAFEEMATESRCAEADLIIHNIPLSLHCRTCGRESSADDIVLQCSICSGSDVRVTRGDEFRLIDVSLQVPVETEGNAV